MSSQQITKIIELKFCKINANTYIYQNPLFNEEKTAKEASTQLKHLLSPNPQLRKAK